MALLSSMWPAMLARVTDVTRTPLSGIVWRSSTNTSVYRYNVPRRGGMKSSVINAWLRLLIILSTHQEQTVMILRTNTLCFVINQVTKKSSFYHRDCRCKLGSVQSCSRTHVVVTGFTFI